MIIGIKVTQKSSCRKGEIVNVENYDGSNQGRLVIKFEDGKTTPFQFPGKIFDFFKFENEEIVRNYIEEKTSIAKTKA